MPAPITPLITTATTSQRRSDRDSPGEALATFGNTGHVSIGRSMALPKIAWGRGVYVYDSEGKQYIDGSGGPAVYCLGYGNAEVNEAIAQQLQRVMHGYRATWTSDALEQLTALVTERCGEPLSSVLFVSGGSEAVEAALKIALQYHSARGEQSRRRFISRQRSWHGSTLGALSISGFLERRAPYEGALIEGSLLSPVNVY